jgi:hypothetical protein
MGFLQVVDLKPIPLAHGHRVHGLSLPAVHLGKGPQRGGRRRGAPGGFRWLRPQGVSLAGKHHAGDEQAGPLVSLGPSPWKCPGDLGEGPGGGPSRGLSSWSTTSFGAGSCSGWPG